MRDVVTSTEVDQQQIIHIDLEPHGQGEKLNPIYAYPVWIDCEGEVLVIKSVAFLKKKQEVVREETAVMAFLVINQEKKEIDLMLSRTSEYAELYIEVLNDNILSFCEALEKATGIRIPAIDYKIFQKTIRDMHWMHRNQETKNIFWSEEVDLSDIKTDLMFYQVSDLLLVFKKEEVFAYPFKSRYVNCFPGRLLFFKERKKYDLSLSHSVYKKEMSRSYWELHGYVQKKIENNNFSISTTY